jgi:hypothetical protein
MNWNTTTTLSIPLHESYKSVAVGLTQKLKEELQKINRND